MNPDPVLAEQIAYYAARAAEYDEWFYRKGRYDQGETLNRLWFEETALLRSTVHQLDKCQNVLELACGTGIWTQELLHIGAHITALDASEEMLAINRAKLNSPQVSYRQVDLFAWEPDAQYDLVIFGFWLSHVPPERLAAFLGKVARALKPNGQFFLMDSRRESTSTAKNQPLPQEGEIYNRRTLNDGRSFTVVKIYYQPADLQNALSQAGLIGEVKFTPNYFIYGSGHKALT